MTEYFTYAIIFLITLLGVEIFRRWSLRRELFDLPNERSSHTIPTPRGGGLIIVAVCLVSYVVAGIFLKAEIHWSYVAGGVAVAVISWIDDLYTISSIWRFAVHIGSALLVILTLGYFENISVQPVGDFKIGLIGTVLTFFWIVWLTNAYNFMDGIDGIAGVQAFSAGLGWLFLGIALDAPFSGFYGGAIACASLGFLILNWQPAKIFMGDVGSAFLGYSFAVLPLLVKNEMKLKGDVEKFLFPSAVLLVWLFAFDTLWTFARRFLKGEKVWQAHRSHIYQKFVINGLSHSKVSVIYGLISLLNVAFAIAFVKNIMPTVLLPVLAMLEAVGLLVGLNYRKLNK